MSRWYSMADVTFKFGHYMSLGFAACASAVVATGTGFRCDFRVIICVAAIDAYVGDIRAGYVAGTVTNPANLAGRLCAHRPRVRWLK